MNSTSSEPSVKTSGHRDRQRRNFRSSLRKSQEREAGDGRSSLSSPSVVRATPGSPRRSMWIALLIIASTVATFVFLEFVFGLPFSALLLLLSPRRIYAFFVAVTACLLAEDEYYSGGRLFGETLLRVLEIEEPAFRWFRRNPAINQSGPEA